MLLLRINFVTVNISGMTELFWAVLLLEDDTQMLHSAGITALLCLRQGF